MSVRKTVTRAGAVALLPMFLSGCGLPIGVQIASWAIDGISLIATEKSVADHGISAVAQQDCAMWRVFKGESVCRETDQSIQTAEAAKLDDEDDNFDYGEFEVPEKRAIQLANAGPMALPDSKFETAADEEKAFRVAEASSMELAIIEMEAHQLAALETAAGSKNGTIAKPTPLPGMTEKTASAASKPRVSQGEILVADASGGSGLISRPLPPPAPTKIEPVKKSALPNKQAEQKAVEPAAPKTPATPAAVETVRSQEKTIIHHARSRPVHDETPVAHEPVAKPDTQQPISTQKPKRQQKVRPAAPKPAKKKAPVMKAQSPAGLYYVLGSFAVEKNAHRMARRAAKLKPKIAVAHPHGKRVMRVMVGPFTETEKSRVRSRIKATDIRGFWILHMKSAFKTVTPSGPQLAAVAN